MKWLIWSLGILIIVSAFAVRGGLVLFGLLHALEPSLSPKVTAGFLLALGYLLFAVIALGGSDEHGAAMRARPVREQREPASDLPTERSSNERAA
jgi:hypothetical protein